jgi:gliding motility-associated-like protein
MKKTKDTMYLDLTKYKVYQVKMVAFNDTNKCADSALYDFKFNGNQPKANAVYTLQKNCPPTAIQFKDSLSTGIQKFWIIPSGDTVTNEQTVSFPVADFGKYKCVRYCVNQFSNQTCIDSQVMLVVLPKPHAEFSISPSKGCTPLISNFLDSNYFKNKSGKWKFGDTTVFVTNKNTEFTFHYPFDSAKTKVTYTAMDSLGRCSATATSIVEISGPNAKINAGFFYTCKLTKLQLSFIPLSKGIKKWEWYADDTLLGNSIAAEFAVYEARNVKVVLKITDSSGCSSILRRTVFVRAYKPLVAIASDTSGALCPPLVVHFKDASTSFNNPVETWLWDFGDGSTSTFKNPSHAFLNTGVYNIKLTVKNFVGCFASKSFPAFIRIFGPKGNIIISPDSGCTPLKANFTSTGSNLKNIQWDFGDGYSSRALQLDHIYQTAGIYTPSAILEDSNACTLGVQSNIKVKTFQTSRAIIKQLSFCDGAILNFADSSKYFNTSPKNKWQHNVQYSTGKIFSFLSSPFIKDSVQFIAYGNLACNDTIKVAPYKSQIKAGIQLSGSNYCIGDVLVFKDKSKSDTGIRTCIWEWNGAKYTGKTFNEIAKKTGYSDVKLTAENNLGCFDSLILAKAVFVGDSLAPAPPNISAVSVTGDLNQELRISYKNVKDWEQFKIYLANNKPYVLRVNSFNQYDSIFELSGENSNLFAQCYIINNVNICKKESQINSAAIHCTVELKTQSDANKIRLNWTPYRGLNVKSYIITRSDFSAGFIVIDSVNGIVNSYIDTSVQCTKKYSYRLIAKLENGYSSFSDTSIARPIYKNKNPNPWINRVTVEPNKTLRIEFEALNFSKSPLVKYSLNRKLYNTFVYTNIKNFATSGPFYFQDNHVNTDSSIYQYQITATDICGETGSVKRFSNNMLLRFNYENSGNVHLFWNQYTFWPGGVDHYEIQQMNEDYVYRTLYSVKDTAIDLKQPGLKCGSLPWYRVMAVSRNNPPFKDSFSLHSSSNSINLSDKPIFFIPNVFTPNDDALNPVFKPTLYWVSNFEMEIYNRWGQLLYKGRTCDAAWDGFYQGQLAAEGNYVYKMKITGTNGKFYYPQGTFILLR